MIRAREKNYLTIGVGLGWVVCCTSARGMEWTGADMYWTRSLADCGKPFTEADALRFIEWEVQREQER